MKLFLPARHRMAQGMLFVALTCAIALGVGLPPSALASTPSVGITKAFSIGTSTVMVEAQINPAGQTTHYRVGYGPSLSSFCDAPEYRYAPEHMTVLETLAFSDTVLHAVTVNITGLTNGDEYCARVIAENGSGTEWGAPYWFTAGAPGLSTNGARATGTTTAAIEGEIAPAGQETTYQVAYSLASKEWCFDHGFPGHPEVTTPPQSLGFTDSSFHPIKVALSGLAPGHEYCAEIIAVNGSGQHIGAQTTFTTTSLSLLQVSLGGSGSGTVTGSGISCP